jgi:hypothetical protein
MKENESQRMEALIARGAAEREDVVLALLDVRAEVERRRTQWKIASLVATGLATTATIVYKLFGKSSVSAKVGKAASALAMIVGLTRAALRVRRFW